MYLFIKARYFIQSKFIFAIFESFRYGNIVLVDVKNADNVLFKKINEPDKPTCTVYIYDCPEFFRLLCAKNELGLGEGYVSDVWSCTELPLFITYLIQNRHSVSVPSFKRYDFFSKDQNTDKVNVCKHYDVGNDFYETFLTDKLSAYTCALFDNDETSLEEGQINKVDTVIRKMNVKENGKILDVGCGWGKIADYVSKQTKCQVTAVTISAAQADYIKATTNVENVVAVEGDYRDITGVYDAIYSLGFMEHVRYENYDTFFQMIKRTLKPGGRCVMHNIVHTEGPQPTGTVGQTFISEHIFPGGQLPCNEWIMTAILRNGLQVAHNEFFGGQHYAKTLYHWRKNMMSSQTAILSKYDQSLIDTYEYYFASCEAAFTAGTMGICHYVITNTDTCTLSNTYR